jgi:hypothetical protein
MREWIILLEEEDEAEEDIEEAEKKCKGGKLNRIALWGVFI